MNVIFFEKGEAEPIARMGGIDAGAVPRPHECVEGITHEKEKRFFVVETTWRKVGEDPRIEAIVTVVPIDAAGRLSSCSAEDAKAVTLSALPDPDGSAGLAERAESGPIAFGDDWPGLFLRGKHALHFYVALGQILDWVEHAHANSEGTAIEDVPQFAVVALDGLRKDLGSVDVRKAPSVLRLRPIEECAAPQAGAVLEHGGQLRLVGICRQCGKRHETLDRVQDLDFDQDYTFECSCGNEVVVTERMMEEAMRDGESEHAPE